MRDATVSYCQWKKEYGPSVVCVSGVSSILMLILALGNYSECMDIPMSVVEESCSGIWLCDRAFPYRRSWSGSVTGHFCEEEAEGHVLKGSCSRVTLKLHLHNQPGGLICGVVHVGRMLVRQCDRAPHDTYQVLSLFWCVWGARHLLSMLVSFLFKVITYHDSLNWTIAYFAHGFQVSVHQDVDEVVSEVLVVVKK